MTRSKKSRRPSVKKLSDKQAVDALREPGININIHNHNVYYNIADTGAITFAQFMIKIREEWNMTDINTTNNNLSGNFSGATVFNDSHIRNAGTIAGGLIKADDSARNELQEMLNKISTALKNRPDDKSEDAEAVASASENFMREANQVKPNPKLLKSLGELFVNMAKDVMHFAPTVVDLAQKIVNMVISLHK